MNSLEKNITDIDSADLEREFQHDNALMEESLRISNGGGFLTRAVRGGANEPFGIEGGSEIEHLAQNRSINVDEMGPGNANNANHNRNLSILDYGMNSSRQLNPI
jgi:hypothetical protein